jgi:hypothetical protein
MVVTSFLQITFLWLFSLLQSMSKLQKEHEIIINTNNFNELNNILGLEQMSERWLQSVW